MHQLAYSRLGKRTYQFTPVFVLELSAHMGQMLTENQLILIINVQNISLYTC